MKKIKAVIFDMDGLLVDSEVIARKCMRRGAENQSLPFDDEFYELFLGCNDEMSEKILYDRYQDEKKVKAIMSDFEILAAQEYENGNVHLKNGCKEIIDYLQKIKLPFALATGSSYKYVEMNFLNNGYKQVPFDYVITGDRITNSKPDPEIFLKAADLMDQDIRDCLIVEDSPKGLEAAKISGAQSCFIPDLVKNQEMIQMADFYRENLLDTIDLIKELIELEG